MPTTAAAIREAMEALDLGQVADLFNPTFGPLVVCDGVSIKSFNEYVGDGEELPIGVRFLQLLADGRLVVVDFPTRVHETTAIEFDHAFVRAAGDDEYITSIGSTTAHRAGFPCKEADAAYGPLARTPFRTGPPPNVTDQITFAVEVGRSQRWESLREAAMWWYGYAGIQYVLLLKISKKAHSLGYELYDVAQRPMGPGGPLPAPLTDGRIRLHQNGPYQPETIELDARRILSIPQQHPLPGNMNDPITVDLRRLLMRIFDAIRRR